VQSIFPTLMSYVPGPHHKAVSLSKEMVEFVAEIVKSCQQTLHLSKPRHFVDCFLIKMEKTTENLHSLWSVEDTEEDWRSQQLHQHSITNYWSEKV
ncbi:hypothetical protein AB205_0006480, partial [Aquarana catesbeiana]